MSRNDLIQVLRDVLLSYNLQSDMSGFCNGTKVLEERLKSIEAGGDDRLLTEERGCHNCISHFTNHRRCDSQDDCVGGSAWSPRDKSSVFLYIKSEYDQQLPRLTKILGKEPALFEQGINALLHFVEHQKVSGVLPDRQMLDFAKEIYDSAG